MKIKLKEKLEDFWNDFKDVLPIIIGNLLWILLVVWLSYAIDNAYNSAKENMEVNIGKQVIMNRDTLQVIDYSIFDNTYTLSNGIIVNSKLIKIIE